MQLAPKFPGMDFNIIKILSVPFNKVFPLAVFSFRRPWAYRVMVKPARQFGHAMLIIYRVYILYTVNTIYF